MLQIGYFRAEQTFFGFTWEDVVDDLAFVLSRYFSLDFGYTYRTNRDPPP